MQQTVCDKCGNKEPWIMAFAIVCIHGNPKYNKSKHQSENLGEFCDDCMDALKEWMKTPPVPAETMEEPS